MYHFIRSAPEAKGGFGFPLILLVMMFNQDLQHPLKSSFWGFMWQTSWISTFATVLPLAIVSLFFRNSSKRRSESVLATEARGREERQRVGYLSVGRDIFLLDLMVSTGIMTLEFFWHSAASHLAYWQFLVVAVWVSVLATTIHILYLKFSDRLTLDPPRPNTAATEQVRWLFKGNE